MSGTIAMRIYSSASALRPSQAGRQYERSRKRILNWRRTSMKGRALEGDVVVGNALRIIFLMGGRRRRGLPLRTARHGNRLLGIFVGTAPATGAALTAEQDHFL